MCATCFGHLILLDLIILVISDEERKLQLEYLSQYSD
jgi:hypothetical protein